MKTPTMKLFNQRFNIKPFTKYFTIISSFIVLFALLMPACINDDEDNSFYTAVEPTIGEYISQNPDMYSEFGKMLDKSGVMGLLNAYGKYTCFLPNNEAVLALYASQGKNSIDDYEVDSIKKIVFDHIIKDDTVPSSLFIDGFLPYLTMSGRYLRINFETSTGKLVYKVNASATVLTPNIFAHNGIIHAIDKVLMPTGNNLFDAILENNKFSLFKEALIETELYKQLLPIQDDEYELPANFLDFEGTTNYVGGIYHVPKIRKYGFTALIESDSIYAQNGINSVDDIKAYAKNIYDKMYPNDKDITDVTDRRNSFNRFVAYHLINKKIPAKYFIEKFDNTGQYYESKGETHSVKTIDMFEYIETMCPNTLLEVRTLRTTNEYNVFNMIEENGKAIRLTNNFDFDALNGVFHEIDNILAYTPDVERMLSSKRLRMDAASFFPELMNNNMRVGHANISDVDNQWKFPSGYIDRVKTSSNTIFEYINADDRFLDYQGDEVYIKGMYDFEIITLPIPAGTYEVRFGYQPTPNRGAAQLYWDGVPTGIPLDLRLLADDPKIGYVKPGEDEEDPSGFENDKMMRNRGYMKAPACFKVIKDANSGGWYSGPIARDSKSAVRRILGIYTFNETTNHTFKVKAVRSGEFMFDYLEFVPLEVLEKEDVN